LKPEFVRTAHGGTFKVMIKIKGVLEAEQKVTRKKVGQTGVDEKSGR
jgi:hypothetical protein